MKSGSSILQPPRFPLRAQLVLGTSLMALMIACGGGGSSTPTPAPASTPTCVTGTLSAFNAPAPVNVSGTNVSGVDINVGGTQSCPAVNAQVLGIANVGASSISATDIGAQVHRGDAKVVILFGPGLSAATNVSITGQPNDFVITNVMPRTANDGTPGIQFQIAVSPVAALGARTVALRAANGDTTVFTGGLEVLP